MYDDTFQKYLAEIIEDSRPKHISYIPPRIFKSTTKNKISYKPAWKNEKEYLAWLKLCKWKAEFIGAKCALWNTFKGFLAADKINKEYYFTKDKTDPNLILKSHIILELLRKFEIRVGEELKWYRIECFTQKLNLI